MTKEMFKSWRDLGLLSLVRSPFLFPSLALHVMTLYLALGIGNFPVNESIIPIPIRLVEMGERKGNSPDKSIGPGQGPGGPRTLPKYGNPVPPRQRTGKLKVGSLETTTPSEEPAPTPQPPTLPSPRALARATRVEPISAIEFSPDSLVQLPIREYSGNTASDVYSDANQKSLAPLKEVSAGTGIRALTEGPQLPGALKGTGTGSGPYGVPGGSRTGTGLTGGGTGFGTGGGSSTGLRGARASTTDYNQYLQLVKKRVNSVWRYPEGVSGLQKVTVRFILDRAGKLTHAEVVDSTDSRINSSALEAMKRASPYPPIPENLKDLAGEPVILRFTVSIRVGG